MPTLGKSGRVVSFVLGVTLAAAIAWVFDSGWFSTVLLTLGIAGIWFDRRLALRNAK